MPFPLNFSATIDGIEGFVFGNVITTNYLPAVYQTTKLAFTVTKVEHLIANNDWTTILSTVCRLLPDENSVNKVRTNNVIAQPDLTTK